MNDWQTPAALAVVGITAGLLLFRFLKSRSGKQSGCRKCCGCETEKKMP